MPCYTEWNAYLEKGSKEYETAKAKLEARLEAIKHIVDYYFGVCGLTIPQATHSGERTWMEAAHREFVCDEGDTQGKDEKRIIKNIAHHCSCDGVHFTLLYDLATLLDINNGKQGGYARIIMACANEIRANKSEYEFALRSASKETKKSNRLDPKRLP